MKRLVVTLALWLAACQETPSTAVAAASVGLAIGGGTHAGVIQEARGTKVELVPFSDGTVRAYITGPDNQPVQATANVTATITAPDFSPTEFTLAPAEGGAFLIGKLPGAAPKTPAQVDLVFPEGVTLNYPSVPLVSEAITLAPPQLAVVAPEAPPITVGVPADFKAPHKGTVTRVGDNLVEVVIAPKGEVQAYAYEIDGDPIPVADLNIPEVEVVYESKPYKVKLAPAKADPYFVGYIDAKITIPASARVDVRCPRPVIIRGVTYEPSVIIFPAPIVVVEPVVVIAPPVIVAPPVVVAPTPPIVIGRPGVVIVPPSVKIGVGVQVGGGVYYSGKHSHKKGKGHYKHSHKHSH